MKNITWEKRYFHKNRDVFYVKGGFSDELGLSESSLNKSGFWLNFQTRAVASFPLVNLAYTYFNLEDLAYTRWLK